MVRSRLGIRSRLIQRRFLGRDLIVRDGAIREQPDYDDAWLLACALRAEIVFDVGANVGQAALIELSSATVREVILIEASPEASLLRRRLLSAAGSQRERGLLARSQGTLTTPLRDYGLSVQGPPEACMPVMYGPRPRPVGP